MDPCPSMGSHCSSKKNNQPTKQAKKQKKTPTKYTHPSSKLQLCHFSVSVTSVITRGQCHHRLQHRQHEQDAVYKKWKRARLIPTEFACAPTTKYNKFTSLPLLCGMEGGWLEGALRKEKDKEKKESESWKEMGAGIKAQLGRLLCKHKRYCLQILKQTSPTCVKACT